MTGGPARSDRARRRLLTLGAGLGAWLLVRPASAADGDIAAAIRAYAGGAEVRTGRVTLDVPKLVDNGNSVPLAVSVESPMTREDHVTAIAIFNERNPERDVARFTLGPRSGLARVSTRIRLATSQKLVAVARTSDGAHWSGAIDVVVVLAACIEGES